MNKPLSINKLVKKLKLLYKQLFILSEIILLIKLLTKHA